MLQASKVRLADAHFACVAFKAFEQRRVALVEPDRQIVFLVTRQQMHVLVRGDRLGALVETVHHDVVEVVPRKVVGGGDLVRTEGLVFLLVLE